MPRKEYKDMPSPEAIRRLKEGGIAGSRRVSAYNGGNSVELDDMEDLDERVRKIIGIIDNKERRGTNMLFFVMYDIESNKVRTQIAKYLLREGCTRIQNSIFLGDLPAEKMDKIRTDLVEVQGCYDNHDSILVVPISADYLQAMKVIGKDINVDLIMHKRNTLFF